LVSIGYTRRPLRGLRGQKVWRSYAARSTLNQGEFVMCRFFLDLMIAAVGAVRQEGPRVSCRKIREDIILRQPRPPSESGFVPVNFFSFSAEVHFAKKRKPLMAKNYELLLRAF
jgi:hypothetical protein